MKKLLYIIITMLLTTPCFGEETSGGVNFKDSLSYQKPAFYSITVPDESTCPNKYYIDLEDTNGYTACSESEPCNALQDLSGKTGMNGGPAYVYVKNDGDFFVTSGTVQGSSGNEIVIKPWLSSGEMTLTNGEIDHSSATTGHIIIDGGPSMLFKFVGESGHGEGVIAGHAFQFNSSNVTLYRCQVDANPGTGGSGAGEDGYTITDIKIINCEYYDSRGTLDGTVYLFYPGGGSSCSTGSSTINNVYVYNSIFRDIGAEAIELNPRTAANGFYVRRNAFHNIGQRDDGWGYRPPVIITSACSGDILNNIQNVYIENNLMWDSGDSCIHDYGRTDTMYIYHNTCYDWAVSQSAEAVERYSDVGTTVIRNNIFWDPEGNNPFDGSTYTASNNACASGESCGTSSQVVNSGDFTSTNEDNSGFMVLVEGSNLEDAGYATGHTASYFGDTRSGSLDIGADEAGAGAILPITGITSAGGLTIH